MVPLYRRSIVTMALSGVVSEIQRNIGADSQFSPPLPYLTSRDGEPRPKFYRSLVWKNEYDETNRRSKKFQDRFSRIVYTQYRRVTDRQTERHTPHDGIDHAVQSVAWVKVK